MSPVEFRPIVKERAAEILSVSKRTIENWIAAGEMPAPIKIGRRVYWHPDTFYAWLNRKLAVPEPPASLPPTPTPAPRRPGRPRNTYP